MVEVSTAAPVHAIELITILNRCRRGNHIKIVFICSDMWEPYLKVIREKCSEALHILDRFHIVAKMNKALDEVRNGESRRMASEAGHRS